MHTQPPPHFPHTLASESNMMQSTPLSFRDIFNQYFQMAHRIRKHYLSPRVLFCLLTGKLVPPINRKNLYSLQYSMLPDRRASVADVWAALNDMPLPTAPRAAPNLRTTSRNSAAHARR